MIHFPRPSVAAELVRSLSGQNPFSDAPNGLFLAAPRRTGKTEFLRNDLIPALNAGNVRVIYVDLWEHKERDPGELIAAAIARCIDAAKNRVQKAADAINGSISLFGVQIGIDPAKIGKLDGVSVPEALQRFQEATNRPVCLIVDEAQHALTSESGVRTMASLKSARDQMNQPGLIKLMLVMSGSDRDKLLRLVNSNAAPFFGSQITRMPTLGADFVAHLAKVVASIHPELPPIDVAKMEKAFGLFGSRPQFLIAAIDATFASRIEDRLFEDQLLARAEQAKLDAEEEMAATYCALPVLQQAVLWRMCMEGSKFRPYDAKALEFYKAKTHEAVTAQQVQQSLERLRQRDDPLVWKSARGEYSVEDSAMVSWFESMSQAGKWPPTP